MPDWKTLPLTLKALSLLAVTVMFGWVEFGGFLRGDVMFFHDSAQAFTLPHLFYERLFNFSLPLWSPEINAGQPLWPILEAYPVFDPLMLAVWFIGHLCGAGSIILGEITVLLWLFAFSAGGLLLSRRFSKNWLVNLMVFALLFGGPVAWSLPGQWNFLLPFRYLPYAMLAVSAFLKKPGRLEAATAGLVLAASHAGYQQGYLLTVTGLYAAGYAFTLYRRGLAPKPSSGSLALLAGTWLAGSPALAAAGLKLVGMVPYTRLHSYSWTLSPADFFNGLILPHSEQMTSAEAIWHGSSAIGSAAVALMLVPFAAAAVEWGKGGLPPLPPDKTALRNALFAVIIPTAVLGTGLFGLEEFFASGNLLLGVRNWGYVLPAVILGFALLAALGAEQMSFIPPDSKPLKTGYAALLTALFAAWLYYGGTLTLSRAAAALALPLFALFFYLNRRHAPALGAVCASGILLAQVVFVSKLPGLQRDERNPAITPLRPALPAARGWCFDHERNAPFIILGPAFLHQPSAVMEPKLDSRPMPVCTDLVQLPRYNILAAEPVKYFGHIRKTLGVTAPVLRTVHSVTRAESMEEANRILKNSSPDKMDEWAVIEGAVPPLPPEASAPTGTDSIRLADYTETETKLDVIMRRPGVLIYSDNWDEGWRVFVDGRRAPLLIANVTNKAVFLPAGRHAVSFKYMPLAYITAFWWRLLFYAAAVPALCLIWRRKQREQPAETAAKQ